MGTLRRLGFTFIIAIIHASGDLCCFRARRKRPPQNEPTLRRHAPKTILRDVPRGSIT